jgi:hypothetical protein
MCIVRRSSIDDASELRNAFTTMYQTCFAGQHGISKLTWKREVEGQNARKGEGKVLLRAFDAVTISTACNALVERGTRPEYLICGRFGLSARQERSTA